MLSLLLPFLAMGTSHAMPLQARQDFSPMKYADCWSFNTPVTASGVVQDLSSLVTSPASNQAWTEEQIRYYSKNSTMAEQVLMTPRKNVSGTYNFYMEYCQPKNGSASGVFQATHGNSASSVYWNVQVDNDDNEYSFADAAAKNGWATIFYDRLGVGRSDHPDGINVVQVGYEISQVAEIGKLVRSGGLGNGVPAFDKVVAVGHSFGSIITLGTTALAPETFDAVVLTGASGDLVSQDYDSILGVGGGQVLIASTVYPLRFEDLGNDYMVSANHYLDQQGFFHYPNYTQEAFDTFTQTVGENSIGQIRTSAVGFEGNRTAYTKPTFVISGDYDAPACLANCSITGLPFPDQLAAAKLYFPSVSQDNFDYYIVPDTGHAINYHPTAPMAYQKIFDFVFSHV